MTVSEERWVAHAFIIRGNKALFIRRNEDRYLGGRWDVPGGQVESGETPDEAAVREVREESGLSGLVVSELSHQQNEDTEGRAIVFHTVTFGLAEDDSTRPVVIEPREHSDYRWATYAEATELPLVWHVRNTVESVFGENGEFA